MEALRRTLAQFMDLYRTMSASQRISLIGLPALVIAAIGFMMFNGQSSTYVPVSYGKLFTSRELENAEQSLINDGLTDYRREGRRLLVPKSDIDRANGALLKEGALPDDWAAEIEKQIDGGSPFEGLQQRKERMEFARSRAIERLIEALDDVEDAIILPAQSTRRTPFRSSANPSVTATVGVLPRAGRQLGTKHIQSIRFAVAGAIPDLRPDDVVVMDLSTNTTLTPLKGEDAANDQVIEQVKQFEHKYQSDISMALSYIKDVLVVVTVDPDEFRSKVKQSRQYDPKGSVAIRSAVQKRSQKSTDHPSRGEPGQVSNRPASIWGGDNDRMHEVTESDSIDVQAPSFTITNEVMNTAPKSVRVAVSIPNEFYESIARKYGLTDSGTEQQKKEFVAEVERIRKEEEARVSSTVVTLIPTETPAQAVNVTTYTRLPNEGVSYTPPWTETVTGLASEWGSALALCLFAIWALRMLNKSMKGSPAESPHIALARLSPETDETEIDEAPLAPTQREMLQSVVRDDPEMAAAVLNKWIRSAK